MGHEQTVGGGNVMVVKPTVPLNTTTAILRLLVLLG